MPSPSVANYYIPMSNGCIYPIGEKSTIYTISTYIETIYTNPETKNESMPFISSLFACSIRRYDI